MSRKSGNRFSEKDMRKVNESRVHPDSTEPGCALASLWNGIAKRIPQSWQHDQSRTAQYARACALHPLVDLRYDLARIFARVGDPVAQQSEFRPLAEVPHAVIERIERLLQIRFPIPL